MPHAASPATVPFLVLGAGVGDASASATDALPAEDTNSFNPLMTQRDISGRARFVASSSKPGHPAENLRVARAEDVGRLWQSDGVVPHFLRLELDRQHLLSVPRAAGRGSCV